MIVKLLTKHHLEFLSLSGGCRGSTESTLVKMSNCWKSHAAAHILYEENSLFQNQLTKAPDAKPLDQDLNFICQYSPKNGIKVTFFLMSSTV